MKNKLLSRYASDDSAPNSLKIIKSFDQTFSKVWPPAGSSGGKDRKKNPNHKRRLT